MRDHGGQGAGFYWGTATAAYQIEGHPLADGAGACIWHEFSHTPNTTYEGHNGDIAVDHYHRWADDIALMRDLGLGAYRFSVRWPRIQPEGTGPVNPAGLSFYDRLVDALLEAGIEPFCTLFHWDMPAALGHLGGWANRDVASWFAEYAGVLAEKLGDRVKNWMTLNEPFIHTELGYLRGLHAPGMKNVFHAGASVHNQIRAHVAAHRAIRAAQADAAVGLACHNAAVWPASPSPKDAAAAEKAHCWHNFPMFVDPLVFGRYPDALEGFLGPYLPAGYENDMDGLRLPPDFLGLNYYLGYHARHDENEWLGLSRLAEPEVPRTGMGWQVRPEGLHWILTQAHERYHLPALYVTENGAAYDDHLDGGGVHDMARTEYLRGHVTAVLKAKQEGVPVKGYFVWSFMDNFEWAMGYSKRFGIVHVDFETQVRVVKDSGHWYSQVAKTGTVPPEQGTNGRCQPE